jgi:hypothetical protein
MAIFQTGAAVSMPALLDTLATFCVANGWVQNWNAVEGSGRRVHLKLGTDVFINLRALVGEQANGSGVNVNGISISGSTSYDGAQTWVRQPGAPHTTVGVTDVMMTGIGGVLGAIPTYYFFARGNMIYVWVEYTAGQYQWFVFGKTTKQSTWVGGMFFAGSMPGNQNDITLATGKNIAGAPATAFSNGMTGNGNAYMYGVIGADTGWMAASAASMSPAMPKFFDILVVESQTFINLSNTFNSQPVLVAVELCITRDGNGVWSGSSNFSLEATLPDMYFCNMRTLLPGQQLDDGSGNIFRVLPFRNKSTTGNAGGWNAVAIKEN